MYYLFDFLHLGTHVLLIRSLVIGSVRYKSQSISLFGNEITRTWIYLITLVLYIIIVHIISYQHLILTQGYILHVVCWYHDTVHTHIHAHIHKCIYIYIYMQITLATCTHTCSNHVHSYTSDTLAMYTHIRYKPLLSQCCMCYLVHDCLLCVFIFMRFLSCLLYLVSCLEKVHTI